MTSRPEVLIRRQLESRAARQGEVARHTQELRATPDPSPTYGGVYNALGAAERALRITTENWEGAVDAEGHPVDFGPPQPGDYIEALEDGPFLTKGWIYRCLDVRAAPTAEKRTSPLLRVEYASVQSPNGKVFGPPIDRFRVVHRPGYNGEVFVAAPPQEEN